MPEAKETCKEIKEKFNVKCEAFEANVSNIEDVKKLYEAITVLMGTVDILVNNAGVLCPLSIFEGENNDIKRVIDVNLTSHFWVPTLYLF